MGSLENYKLARFLFVLVILFFEGNVVQDHVKILSHDLKRWVYQGFHTALGDY